MVVAALALVAGACGSSGDDSPKKASESTTSSTASANPSTTEPDGATTTAAALSGSGATTTAKGAAGAKPAPTSPPPAGRADPNAIPAPAKNGTYVYSQSGSGPDGPAPARGTLVISGGSTQTFKRYFDESKPPNDLIFDFGSAGPTLKSAVVPRRGRRSRARSPRPYRCRRGRRIQAEPSPDTPPALGR